MSNNMATTENMQVLCGLGTIIVAPLEWGVLNVG